MGVPAHTTGSSAVRQETARSGEQTPGKPISSWQTTGAFLDISAPVPKIPNKAVVGIGKTLLPESDTVPAQLRGCHITLNPSSRNVSGTRTTPRCLSRGVRAPPCSPHSSNPGCSCTRKAAHFLCLVTVRNTWPEKKFLEQDKLWSWAIGFLSRASSAKKIPIHKRIFFFSFSAFSFGMLRV